MALRQVKAVAEYIDEQTAERPSQMVARARSRLSAFHPHITYEPELELQVELEQALGRLETFLLLLEGR